jgi:hypothetical protein
VLRSQLLAQLLSLTSFKFGDADAVPAFGAADESRIHQLHHGPFPKEVERGFQPPALLHEEAFEEIGCPGHFAMRGWQVEMGDAGVEVLKVKGRLDSGGFSDASLRRHEAFHLLVEVLRSAHLRHSFAVDNNRRSLNSSRDHIQATPLNNLPREVLQ